MAAEYVIFVLAIIFFIVLCAIWSLHFIALVYGKYKFHRESKHIEKDQLPGISIIKPLMGVDENLLENLETFFVMDYPIYEILFCVQDCTDPVINIVKHLMEKYPNIDAKLFSGGKNVGINPKINNMIQGYEVAQYEFIMISDAGLKMASDSLYDMYSLMTERVGLVHQMPFVCDRPGFAGSLEKVYFGTCHSRQYLFINLLGVNCVTGMSCLLRKSVLDQVGGLKKFGNYIAEDYFIAQSYIDNNWIIQLAHKPAMQNSAVYSVSSWQKRMIRWCKMRLRMTAGAWLEPMQECFVLGLYTSWTVNILFGWNSLVFFMIHVLAWFLSDYMMLKIVQNGKLPFTKFEYVLAWFYRETICLYLFIKAATNPTVKWRDGKYRLKWGGLAEEIIEKKSTELKAPIKSNSNLIDEKSYQFINISSSSLVTNGKKIFNHKRNNSYSVLMNSNNNNIGENNINQNLNVSENKSQTPRSLHQHHHSISTPISAQAYPQLLVQTTNEIDISDLKFKDSKLV